jgi:hypothetical protein
VRSISRSCPAPGPAAARWIPTPPSKISGSTGGGDFVELFAKRLPLQTISDMLGVPEADRQRVMEAADTLVTAADPEVMGDRHPLELLVAALWTLTEFATELTKHRERHAGDDLMTALVQAEVDGDRSRATATSSRSSARGASTSPATRTGIWASAAAGRTTAWAPRSRAPSCRRSTARCCA